MPLSDAQPSWRLKLDHRLQALLERATAAERRQHVSVFVRFSGDAAMLRKERVTLGNVAGDIAVAMLMLEEIPRLAALDQVHFIELSSQLFADGAAGTPQDGGAEA